MDGNLTSSHNANSTAGCLSSVLRRFVCTGSFPTYQSSFTKEPNAAGFEDQKDSHCEEKIEEVPAPATPGIVARLMGLESMPDLNLVATARTPTSFRRSQSTNSINYWSEFDPTQGRHQWVRTCSSFREMGRGEFFLLSFENVGDCKEFGLKGKKSGMGNGEIEQGKKTERVKNKESRREKVVDKNKKEEQNCNNRTFMEKKKKGKKITDDSSQTKVISPQKKNVCRKPSVDLKAISPSKPRNQKEVSEVATLVKKKKRRSSLKKVEPDCSLENSNLDSVLDLAEKDSRMQRSSNSKSRRKLLLDLVNSDYPSPHLIHASSSAKQKPRSNNGEGIKSTKKDSHTREYFEMLREISKLTEEGMTNSDWLPRERWKLEDLEEVLIEFGLQIVDGLLHEVVTELAGFPMENFCLF